MDGRTDGRTHVFVVVDALLGDRFAEEPVPAVPRHLLREEHVRLGLLGQVVLACVGVGVGVGVSRRVKTRVALPGLTECRRATDAPEPARCVELKLGVCPGRSGLRTPVTRMLRKEALLMSGWLTPTTTSVRFCGMRKSS